MRRVSAIAAVAAGAVGVLAVGTAGGLAVGPALLGLALLASGVVRGRRSLVTGGAVLLFVGVLAATLGDLAPGLALVGALASIVAWDAATFGIELDEQLGGDAETGRAELVHLGTTLAGGGAVASLAYLAAVVSVGRFPALAAIAIVAGAWLLAMGLEPSADPEVESW